MMKWISLLLDLLGICGVMAGCGNATTENQTGGASETINATVIVLDSSLFVNIKTDGEVYGDIRLLGADYNPTTSKGYSDSAVVVSSDVGIKITAVSGKYNCIIKDRISTKSLLVSGLKLGAGLGDTISDTLAECGSIQGNILLKQVDGSGNFSVKVFLLGTIFQTGVDTSGAFNLNTIPAGSYSIVATVVNNETKSKDINRSIGRNVEVKKGEIITGMTLYFSN